MVLKINIEKTLKEFETRIKELEQSNEELRSQFKYLEEKVKEREVETKAKQEIINNYEEKFRERKEEKQDIINASGIPSLEFQKQKRVSYKHKCMGKPEALLVNTIVI
ncbi:18850_t:CDS:2 [Funneliformis geosporum]|uniref:18850_t:CDS:1 n=1 Tax=Funneliformis geosporum TaxID=1117311 RepID=A0A9W4SMD3_9GLOM|nr:18850_t:CDS:2 [Funneliformis geosporum]